MHARIWQISPEKLDKEEFITEETFYSDGFISYDFFDYVDDRTMEDQENDIKEWLPGLLKDIFECNGRELTFLKPSGFLKEWADKIHELSNNIDSDNLIEPLVLYRLKLCIETTHEQNDHRFYIGKDGCGYPETFGNFIEELFTNYEYGVKFYVGGVVDFHF